MEIPKRRIVKVKWPCIVCDKECRTTCTKKENVRSIECAVCSGWAHEVCASLTPEAFDFFSHTTSLFVCGRCVSDVRPNKYSYRIGITRYKIPSLSDLSLLNLNISLYQASILLFYIYVEGTVMLIIAYQ